MDHAIMEAFIDWLKEKYGWSYGYFCRICGECRQEEIWIEFYREQANKKAP